MRVKPGGWARTVVIADDDAVRQAALRDFIESCGHDALSFEDWKEAHDALSSGKGDRLILSFYMGARRNAGQALLQALRRDALDVPTIITAPRDDSRVTDFCAGFSFVKYFLDPTDLLSHSSRVEEILSLPPGAESSRGILKRTARSGRARARVFVIHGDERHRRRIFTILQNLGVEPIYLHGEPITGKTIIQALEEYAGDVDYAICIFTGDDIGYRQGRARERMPRARQNVVLETGLFIGAISRDNVMVLHEDGIEQPSDIKGIRYVSLSIPNHELRERFIQAFSELSIPYKLVV